MGDKSKSLVDYLSQEEKLHYAGENETPQYLDVYIHSEEITDDSSRGMSVEEAYKKLGLDDETEMTPEMTTEVFKLVSGSKTKEEAKHYQVEVVNNLSNVLSELEEMFKNEMAAKGIDTSTLSFETFRNWLEERRKKPSDVDELIDLTTKEFLSMNPPKNYIMPKTKAMNTLVNPTLTPLNGESSVEFTVKNGNATLKMALDFDKNVEIQDGDHMRFTPYDREVFNGICSRYENDNDTFTAEQIYRTINGLSNRETVSETSIKRINDSINKMIKMRVKIDYTEEMKKFKNSDKIQEYIQEDYMIPAKKASLTVNNSTVDGYKLHAKPLMYHYSQISSQIITVGLEILNTKDGTNDNDSINNSPEITVIRAHLIREIEWIKAEMKKKTPKRNNKISLESIYELLELKSPNKKKALKIREHISKILNNFISKNYIKSYDTYKKGRTITGFQVIV